MGSNRIARKLVLALVATGFIGLMAAATSEPAYCETEACSTCKKFYGSDNYRCKKHCL
jgi:hypothetical protein